MKSMGEAALRQYKRVFQGTGATWIKERLGETVWHVQGMNITHGLYKM